MESFQTMIKKSSALIRICALALVLVISVTALAQTVFAKTTYVITDGDQVTVHTTYATDPVDVLSEAGLELAAVDTYVTVTREDVSEITVHRGQTVTIDHCGEIVQTVTYGETVGALLDRLGITVVEDTKLSVSPDTLTHDGMEFSISNTVVTEDSYTAAIPFEVIYKETALLKKGTEVVLTEGVNGQMTCTANVTYVNGKEVSRELLTQTVTTEAVAKVVAVGIGDGKPKGEPIIGDGVIITETGDVVTFTHRETYTATAYCRVEEGGQITATGTPTRVGAIAVDPRYIPYGTRMFIVTQDGEYIYGVATAEDCGGAIKGKRLDLFYETMGECVEFGVRDCDVYFLG